MRLVEITESGELRLTKDFIENVPPYAILSHTWGPEDEEVTFEDFSKNIYKSKPGYAKVRFCAKQALGDRLRFFWVDTCCIDRANHVALQEAISSMFRWYQNAAKCYVYLVDVVNREAEDNVGIPWDSTFAASRWFTRGWTLQELLAPKIVEFFSKTGRYLGDRNSLEQIIQNTTGIPVAALRGAPLSGFSISQRFEWAKHRTTKRIEDQAYCLMGIFDVFIPLIYGEGPNAFARLEEEVEKPIRTALDRLPYARGAVYNSYGQSHTTCHPETRLDLLREIQNWMRRHDSVNIFWLNGSAGTGKSTISWTVSKWLAGQGSHDVVNLGASFFFKRGEGGRGSASRFFPTIARDLAKQIPGLGALIAKQIQRDPSICDEALEQQFIKLVYQPLDKFENSTGECSNFVVVVDALDECDSDNDIDTIIHLFSRLPHQFRSIRLRLFLTSRPDLPVRLAFKSTSPNVYEELILQEAVSQSTLQHDITIFLQSEFSLIKDRYNKDRPRDAALPSDWPGTECLDSLAVAAMPLFIVATTMSRFVGDPRWNPRKRLQTLMRMRGLGSISQLEQMYASVLHQMLVTGDPDYEAELSQEFRTIIGAVTVLATPLSVSTMADLLNVPSDDIWCRLSSLHSVVKIPVDSDTPVRMLHLSFSEFLLNPKLRNQPYGIDGPLTHQMLLKKCLQLMSSPDALQDNIYSSDPSSHASAMDRQVSPALYYACRYWIYHAVQATISHRDKGEVHDFLQNHSLHWLEVVSNMDGISEVMGHLDKLQSLVSAEEFGELASLLKDAQQVLLTSRYIASLAPLQIYSSANIFAPQGRIVKKLCATVPDWMRTFPLTWPSWDAGSFTFAGHTSWVRAVVSSPDGSLLASASDDRTVKLWNLSTGEAVMTLKGHSGSVRGVTFSSDGLMLASTSADRTVRLWNVETGQPLQVFIGHKGHVNAVSFSPGSRLLASASGDRTVRLWSTQTGQLVRILKHKTWVHAVAFSPNVPLLASAFGRTIRLWSTNTGEALYDFGGEKDCVDALAFSPDGLLLASVSCETIRLREVNTGQEVWKRRNVLGIRTVDFFLGQHGSRQGLEDIHL